MLRLLLASGLAAGVMQGAQAAPAITSTISSGPTPAAVTGGALSTVAVSYMISGMVNYTEGTGANVTSGIAASLVAQGAQVTTTQIQIKDTSFAIAGDVTLLSARPPRGPTISFLTPHFPLALPGRPGARLTASPPSPRAAIGLQTWSGQTGATTCFASGLAPLVGTSASDISVRPATQTSSGTEASAIAHPLAPVGCLLALLRRRRPLSQLNHLTLNRRTYHHTDLLLLPTLPPAPPRRSPSTSTTRRMAR